MYLLLLSMALQLLVQSFGLLNHFHLLLSWTRVFQFGTSNLCISFLTSSSQHIFGIPVGLFEMGFQEYNALTILVSCILSIWPYHPNLCTLVKFIMSLCFISLSSSTSSHFTELNCYVIMQHSSFQINYLNSWYSKWKWFNSVVGQPQSTSKLNIANITHTLWKEWQPLVQGVAAMMT